MLQFRHAENLLLADQSVLNQWTVLGDEHGLAILEHVRLSHIVESIYSYYAIWILRLFALMEYNCIVHKYSHTIRHIDQCHTAQQNIQARHQLVQIAASRRRGRLEQLVQHGHNRRRSAVVRHRIGAVSARRTTTQCGARTTWKIYKYIYRMDKASVVSIQKVRMYSLHSPQKKNMVNTNENQFSTQMPHNRRRNPNCLQCDTMRLLASRCRQFSSTHISSIDLHKQYIHGCRQIACPIVGHLALHQRKRRVAYAARQK